jgi:hypothetical protein
MYLRLQLSATMKHGTPAASLIRLKLILVSTYSSPCLPGYIYNKLFVLALLSRPLCKDAVFFMVTTVIFLFSFFLMYRYVTLKGKAGHNKMTVIL